MKSAGAISTVLKKTAKYTLELYIVHVTISSYVVSLKLSFPLNIFIFLVLIIMFSKIIKLLSERKSIYRFKRYLEFAK
jgi:ABC-type transport system involved in multi-copper enzyme maturation permease subunit